MFYFGRSQQEGGPEQGAEDGLYMSRIINGKDHTVILGVHPDVPNITVSSDKSANTPLLLFTGSDDNEALFAVTDKGAVISKGQFEHDFSAIPDSMFGSSVHNAHSVYIGAAKLSYNSTTRQLETHILKENHVPTVLAAPPCSFVPNSSRSFLSGQNMVTSDFI